MKITMLLCTQKIQTTNTAGINIDITIVKVRKYVIFFVVKNIEKLTVNQPKTRLRSNRVPSRGDSESDDTSGSPCGDCPSASNYRVPVKSSRGEHQMAGYTGYETLLVSDLFRPDSSTESNDVSPLAERRHTPRHVGVPRRHHRPTSSSR